MKITKKQLRRIIKEEIEGRDPHEFMSRIKDIEKELNGLSAGIPFRSAGVRMAIEKMRKAMYELETGMKQELKILQTFGD